MKITLGWLIGVLTVGAMLAPVASGQVQAQSAPASTDAPAGRRLPLSEALSLADRQNLDLAAARLRHAVAAAGIIIAGARPNPTVSFSATRDTPHESLFADLPLEVWGQRGKRIAQA